MKIILLAIVPPAGSRNDGGAFNFIKDSAFRVLHGTKYTSPGSPTCFTTIAICTGVNNVSSFGISVRYLGR